MKRLVLLFASVLIGLTTATATELNNQTFEKDLDKLKRYQYAQPITFIERGVEFLIFPDGSFDFNMVSGNHDAYYNSHSRRSNVNISYRGPNTHIQYTNAPINRGLNIIRDRHGSIRSIGNMYLNYDRYGRITRAGSIFMDYERGKHSSLYKVGGLRVDYNKWGEIINIRGQVNRFNTNCNFCGLQSCGVTHNFENGQGHHNNHDNDWDDRYNDDVCNNDENYYYYKQNGKVKKHKKNKKYKR